MDPSHIAALLAPFLRAPLSVSGAAVNGESSGSLSPAQLQSISTYIDILIRWNARINLTAIRDPEDIVTRHFGESLFAARHLFPNGVGFQASREGHGLSRAVSSQEDLSALAPEALTLADLGSGAGFPGLPIKIWSPNISLTLIESNHKKTAFLSEVARSLTLTNVNIQNARAESIAAKFDVVTLRAVEHFDTILPTAAALVAPAGRLALLVGAAQHDKALAAVPDFNWSPPIPTPSSRSRILLLAQRMVKDRQ